MEDIMAHPTDSLSPDRLRIRSHRGAKVPEWKTLSRFLIAGSRKAQGTAHFRSAGAKNFHRRFNLTCPAICDAAEGKSSFCVNLHFLDEKKFSRRRWAAQTVTA
jgi:hypothetical protein